MHLGHRAVALYGAHLSALISQAWRYSRSRTADSSGSRDFPAALSAAR